MRRKILYATGGLLVLLVVAFLLRRQWLAPVIRGQLEQTLARAFDCQVVVGKIGGNLLDEVQISGIQMTGRPGRLLSRLEGGDVRAEFRLLGLLSGEADAIQRLAFDCRELVVDTAGNLPSAGSTGSTAADLHGLLPKGARIHVESLVIRHGGHERRAPFELTLGSLGPTRDVDARHGTSHVQLRLAETGTAEGDIQVADSGGLLRALGFDNDLESGQLRAAFVLGSDRLRVPDLAVSVPGLRLTCKDLIVPFTSDALSQARGEVALDIVDLDRQMARMKVLPKEVRELLPRRGRVRARVADGKLLVADGELLGERLSIQLRQGQLSLARGWTGMSGSIGLTVVAGTPVVLPLPGDRSLGIQGRVEGQLRGSLAELVVQCDTMDVELHRPGQDRGRITVRGRGKYEARQLAAELLVAGEGRLRLAGRYTNGGVLEGDARLEKLKVGRLLALGGLETLGGEASGRIRVKGPELTVDLDGSVEGLLTRLPVTVAEQLPAGPCDLRLAGTVGPAGCQITELRLGARAGGFKAEARGYLPLCWSEGRVAVVPASARTKSESDWLQCKVVGNLPDPLQEGGRVRHELVVALTSTSLEVRKLQAESAAGAVVVRGNVKVSAEGLLDPPPNPQLDLTVDLRSLRLERLPAQWQGAFSVAGVVSGRLQVVGPATRPRVKGSLEGKDLSLRHPQAPALESGAVQLELKPNEVVVKSLTARVGGTRMELAGKVGVDAEDIWLGLDRPDVALTGDLRLEDVPLSFLAPARVGLEEVGGLVSGRLQLGGTVGDPQPRIELSLRKGMARAAGRPPLHDLAIDVVVTERAVNVDRCGGLVGSTPFSLGGALESPAVSLWRLWSERVAAVKGEVWVRDLTLDALPRKWTGLDDLRGRVSGRLKLAGSLAKPEPEGHLQVTGGSVKPPRLPRLEDLHARVDVSGSVVKLAARGTLGAGPVQVEASLADDTTVTGKVVGRDLLLVRGPGMRMRADVNLGVHGNLGEMVVDGRIDITSAKFQRRMSLLPDLRLEGGTAWTRMGPPSIGDERLRFRVDVATKQPAIVRTHVLDADLDAALKVIGPGNALQLQGAVSARSGVLRFPGSSMRLDTGQVMFDPRHPNRPELVVNASGRRYGFETTLVARGRPGDIEVEMSSVPPLSAKEVMVLITTGVPPDRLASRETRANVGLVGSYVLGELLGSFFASESLESGESFAERFQFTYGTEVSRYGKETWAVEYDLSHLGLENFAARVEQDIYEDQSVSLIYKLRF